MEKIRVTNTETFIQKAKQIHGEKYDYSKSIYNGSVNKVKILCSKHGYFEIKADNHLVGNGCKICGNNKKALTKEEVLKRFKEKHQNKYQYPEFEYTSGKNIIKIICPKHGEFEQEVNNHILGYGCIKCGNESKIKNIDYFIQKAKQIHGEKYDYSKSIYTLNRNKILIICPEHGEFEQIAGDHLSGGGCKLCGYERKMLTLEEFIQKAKLIHKDKYDYSISEYNGSYNKVKIKCLKHGEFLQNSGDHLSGNGCPRCASENRNYSSKGEKEVANFIRENSNYELIERYTINRKELDIFLPELNLGIEFNGTFWHSHINKPKKYHKEKSDFFERNEINVFHIWEHAWSNPIKQNIIKSMLLNKLGLIKEKIYARKCQIKEISSKEFKEFCLNNHIQGACNSKIKLGLFYNNELVQCMGFGNLRRNLGNKIRKENHYELTRLCVKLNTSIIGGASKLLKHFEKTYKPQYIISYADRDYSQGKIYNQLEFKNKGISNINYLYFNPKDGIIKNRYCYRKDELVKLGYNKNMTELEMINDLGLYQIYNSGIIKFEKFYN